MSGGFGGSMQDIVNAALGSQRLGTLQTLERVRSTQGYDSNAGSGWTTMYTGAVVPQSIISQDYTTTSSVIYVVTHGYVSQSAGAPKDFGVRLTLNGASIGGIARTIASSGNLRMWQTGVRVEFSPTHGNCWCVVSSLLGQDLSAKNTSFTVPVRALGTTDECETQRILVNVGTTDLTFTVDAYFGTAEALNAFFTVMEFWMEQIIL